MAGQGGIIDDPEVRARWEGFQWTPENAKQGEAALWAAYDAIRCPVLLVRGADSDLLSRDTAQQMSVRGPRAKVVELPGVGHAPTFMHADQIALARGFFLD